MAQSFGYLLAAFGPVLVGGLHDMMNGWMTPLFLLILLSIVLFIVGIASGKEGYVTESNIDKAAG